MKRHLPFLVATLLCLPFLAVVIIFLLALAFGNPPDCIGIPLLYSLFWLTTWPLVVAPVLALVSASVIAAWLQKSKTRFEFIAISIYSMVMLLHIGYVIWWHVTGQVWDL